MLLILAAFFGISVILNEALTMNEHITTVFVFAVFIISIFTDGYVYGIIATFIAVLGINYAFTFPFFAFNFTIPENLLSALIMFIVSVTTSAVTVRLKNWEAFKAESGREKMRADLLRAISHDLRTPLTTIYGSSAAILENYDSFTEEQKKKMLCGIKEDSEWLVRIVENLLSVTKLNDGNIKLIKTPTPVDELIDTVLIKFKKRYSDTKISLHLPEEVIIVPMDALLCEQVLTNILDNAVHHAEGMTEIVMRVYALDGRAIFEISDDGVGIAPEKLPHLFSGRIIPSERNADNKKRNAGIGLSLCSSIIKAHGGEITAENKKEGGALFRFSLSMEISGNVEQ